VTHYSGTVLQEQHYYPHGLAINTGESPTTLHNRYKYQGQELQEDLGEGLYDFTARNYDQQIGRFWGLDPMNQFPCGYTGMGNDPANHVDPSGLWSSITHGGETEYNSSPSLFLKQGAIRPLGDWWDSAPKNGFYYSGTDNLTYVSLGDVVAIQGNGGTDYAVNIGSSYDIFGGTTMSGSAFFIPGTGSITQGADGSYILPEPVVGFKTDKSLPDAGISVRTDTRDDMFTLSNGTTGNFTGYTQGSSLVGPEGVFNNIKVVQTNRSTGEVNKGNEYYMKIAKNSIGYNTIDKALIINNYFGSKINLSTSISAAGINFYLNSDQGGGTNVGSGIDWKFGPLERTILEGTRDFIEEGARQVVESPEFGVLGY